MIFSAILALVFSGSYTHAQEDSVSSIRSKVEKFDFSLHSGKYENIWDMASPDFKARVARQDYASYIRNVLGVTVTVQYSRFATIEIYNDSVAISQHVIDLKRDKRIFGTIICQAIIWERVSGEWRFSQIFPCENQAVIFNR